jgi:hypothetical protein
MVLMNAKKIVRYTDSLVNQYQGGGPKKAGSPPTVGKEWHVHQYQNYHNSHPLTFWRTTTKFVKGSLPLPVGTAYNILAR